MGYFTALDLKNQLGCEEGLKMHLRCNFYPRMSKDVINSTIKGFQKYWKEEISIEELAKECHFQDVDSLYEYHSLFLEYFPTVMKERSMK